MFGRFKKLVTRNRPDAILGFGCAVKNTTLGLDLLGSPTEVRENAARQVDLPFSEVLNHIDSEVSLFEVKQKEPLLEWRGGPHAERLMHLLDTVTLGKTMAVAEFSDVLNPRVKGSYVAIIYAAATGQLDMIKALIGAGASANAMGDLGMSALHWASVRGHDRVASALVSAGADVAASNWFCLTPADVAALNSHRRLAQKLNPAPGVTNNANWHKVTIERMLAL